MAFPEMEEVDSFALPVQRIKTPLGTCPSRKSVILRRQMDLEPARSIWSSRLQHLPQNALPQAE
jgi:hypothetical protein